MRWIFSSVVRACRRVCWHGGNFGLTIWVCVRARRGTTDHAEATHPGDHGACDIVVFALCVLFV